MTRLRYAASMAGAMALLLFVANILIMSGYGLVWLLRRIASDSLVVDVGVYVGVLTLAAFVWGLVTYRRDEGHGLSAIMGKWPGDETDEQINEALKKAE